MHTLVARETSENAKMAHVSRETRAILKDLLLLHIGINDLHDPVEVLNGSELDAYFTLSGTKLNLYIRIQAICQRCRQEVESLISLSLSGLLCGLLRLIVAKSYGLFGRAY